MLVLLLHFRLYGLMTERVVLSGVGVLAFGEEGGDFDFVSTDSMRLLVTNSDASVRVLKLWCMAPGYPWTSGWHSFHDVKTPVLCPMATA